MWVKHTQTVIVNSANNLRDDINRQVEAEHRKSIQQQQIKQQLILEQQQFALEQQRQAAIQETSSRTLTGNQRCIGGVVISVDGNR